MTSLAVRFAVDLARKNCEALLFIPAPRIEEYERQGRLLIGQENGEPCGFLIYGNGYPTLKIYQACIQYDARRHASGLALVDRLKAIAVAQGRDISLWCASDLEANRFWEAVGFRHVARRNGGSRRQRVHFGWRCDLAPSLVSCA